MDDIVRNLVPDTENLKKIGPIFDKETYLRSGLRAMHNLQRFGYLKSEDSVLDIGCGYGRVAIHLGNFLKAGGKYVGLDVVKEEIQWGKDRITPQFPHLEFHHLDVANQRYHPEGAGKAATVRLPVADASIDFTFLISVFTHMFPADVKNYLQEIERCLKPGGVLFASFFMINEEREAFITTPGNGFPFRRKDGYWAFAEVHEAAIAYTETDVYDMLRATGFLRDKVIFGSWAGRQPADFGQDVVVCIKKPA